MCARVPVYTRMYVYGVYVYVRLRMYENAHSMYARTDAGVYTYIDCLRSSFATPFFSLLLLLFLFLYLRPRFYQLAFSRSPFNFQW